MYLGGRPLGQAAAVHDVLVEMPARWSNAS
jgi:hypothetical protein